MITATIRSTVTGRVVKASYTPQQLLNFIDEDDLVTNATMCECQPVGENNFLECNCDEEWDDSILTLE